MTYTCLVGMYNDELVKGERASGWLAEDVSSDELIDEGRYEVRDTIDLGRAIPGCDD